MKLNVRKQLYLFNAGIIVGLAIIGGLIVYPSIKEINTLQNSIQKTHNYLEGRYLSIQRSKKTVTQLPEIEPQVAIYQKSFIEAGHELSLITQLEALAEKHSVDQQLSATRVTDPAQLQGQGKKGRNRPHYQFSFLNQGTFANHLAYLHGLEQLPYYMKIDRVVFEKPQDQTKHGLVTLRFDGIIYAAE